MKAIRLHETGGPEVMLYEEVARPEPGPGEVRVRIEAAGVNFIDIYHRRGAPAAELPFTPGMEAAGIVDAVGAGVAGLQLGDRVGYSSSRGAYAQYALVPAEKLVAVPEGIETAAAAAALLQGMTAHYLTHDTYPLQAGDTALVHAAAGGTGLLLVQMAKSRGARVIGTVSTEEKALLASDFGADELIVYTKLDFEDEVKHLTGGQGVDVVYDSVGASTFDKGLNCLRRFGMMVLYGQSSGPVAPVNPQTLNAKGSLYLTRPSLFHHVAERDQLLRRSGDLFAAMASGELRVRIDRTFPLAQAAAAHRYLEGRQTQGKALLLPDNSA